MHFVKAKSILSAQGGMNLYRGCTHGCIYCDSRSTCYQMDHPFEDVAVKENAPELLEAALRRRRKRCMIGTGAMCDPYLPIERDLELTRRCLEIIRSQGFGATVLTKSDLVLRDLDLLEDIDRRAKAVVQMTLTTYDEGLCRIVEPGVCGTHRRYEVLKAFQARGVPRVVWLCPILPMINDTPDNIRGIVDLCADAGVWGIMTFGMGLTLREGDREYYYAALDRHFPGLREEYIRRYGNAYELPSPREGELWKLLREECEGRGIETRRGRIFAFLNELPEDNEQLSMF